MYLSGKALTAKIVAKNGASQEDISKEKTLLKRAKRGEERAAAAALKRAEEKERQRMENMVKPYDMAKEQMIIMAGKLPKETSIINKGEEDECDVYNSQQKMIAECKEMQVNEVLGLEAIYNTDDGDDDDVANKEFCIAESSKFELLQQLIEDWQIDPESEQTLEKIVKHPPLSFTIQLVVDGTVHSDGDDVELATVILLNVTLPSLYPMGESSNNNLPTFDIAYFCCTDREMKCTPDKPLNSLADLDETGLKESLIEEAQQFSPDPSIYMVVCCLMERIFEFVSLSVHGKHVLDQKRNSSDQ